MPSAYRPTAPDSSELQDAQLSHKRDNARRDVQTQGKGNNRPLWRPFSHSAVFLITFIFLSIGLFVFLQVLLVQSQRNNGVYFAKNISDLSFGKTFSYNYLPTIIAVLYSLAWSWVDADSKRLETFYQLSAPDGVCAEDSLNLEYAFAFGPVVPINSLRKRHWPVFAGSLAMVLISWGITPIQAGIFSSESIRKNVPVPFLLSTDHVSVGIQNESLSANFTYSVYSTIFFNASLPTFTTRDYALRPFRSREDTLGIENDETWIAPTRMFSVDLDCKPARFFLNETNQQPFYTDDAGCTIPRYGPTGAEVAGEPSDLSDPGSGVKRYTSFFAGYVGFPGDVQLRSFCPENYSNSFFASFSKARSSQNAPSGNVTAIFCKSRYYTQAVNATIQLPQWHVSDVAITGPLESLSADVLDTSAFDSAVANTGNFDTSARTDIPDNTWASPGSQLYDLDINYIVNGVARLPDIIPYSIFSYNKSVEIYVDPEELKNSYQTAWRIFFARHMADVLNTNYSDVTEISGERAFTAEAIVMVPSFTIIVEVLIVMVAFLAAWLLLLVLRRPHHLASDPGSISSMMSLVADDEKLLRLFSNSDQLPMRTIRSQLKHQRFALSANDETCTDGSIHLLSEENKHNDTHEQSSKAAKTRLNDFLRPIEIHSGTVLTLFLMFSLILVAGIVLFIRSRLLDGLSLPSQSRFVRQLVESYLPTAIATAIEPCWVSINRLLCLLFPWDELRKNRAHAKKSISVNYFDLPPQLVLFKALQIGHLVLSAICLMALLANVLAVAFSAILYEGNVSHAIAWPMVQTYSTEFKGSDYPIEGGATNITTGYTPTTDFFSFAYENYLPIMSNLTLNSNLPTWSDEHFFYVPFDTTSTVNVSASRRAITRAFGARLECQNIQAPPGSRGGNVTYNAVINLADGQSIQCGHRSFGNVIRNCTEGQSAAEWVLHMGPVNGSDGLSNSVCKSFTNFGWFRAIGPDKCPDSYNELDPPSMTITDQLVLGCRSFLSTALANVTVDAVGNVQSANLVTDIDDNVALYFRDSGSAPLQILGPWTIDTVLRTKQNLYSPIMSPDRGPGRSSPWALGYWEAMSSWHTDSYSSDHANWLLSKMNTSSTLLDPNAPLPNAQDVATQLSAMHSVLFSTLLGSVRDKVLEVIPSNTTSIPVADSQLIIPQTRIFVSTPMFIIATIILTMNIITLIVGYIHRPGRFLPRMPTTFASVIAYLAASNAVTDFRGTAHMTNAQRDVYVEKLGRRYGYGAFTGTDGRRHIGVEYFGLEGNDLENVSGKGLVGQLHKDLPRWDGWQGWWARARIRGARVDSLKRATQANAKSENQKTAAVSFWMNFVGKKTKEEGRVKISVPLMSLSRP